MNPLFVVHASIAIAWVRDAQATPESEAALEAVRNGATTIAPALWTLEIANALLVLVRRKKLSEADRAESLRRLAKFPVQMDYEFAKVAFTAISDLAVAHQLSIYDGSYLELAKRLALPLACKNGALKDAAPKCGVHIWSP